jgi:hypothetical protein
MTTTTARVVDVRPAATEVAVIHLPPGSVARVHHPAGHRDYTGSFHDLPIIMVIPGDRDTIGWGWTHGEYFSLQRIRNGHHQLDRPVWHDAVRAVRGGGVVYIRFEQRDWYGKQRWAATGLRLERKTC